MNNRMIIHLLGWELSPAIYHQNTLSFGALDRFKSWRQPSSGKLLAMAINSYFTCFYWRRVIVGIFKRNHQIFDERLRREVIIHKNFLTAHFHPNVLGSSPIGIFFGTNLWAEDSDYRYYQTCSGHFMVVRWTYSCYQNLLLVR